MRIFAGIATLAAAAILNVFGGSVFASEGGTAGDVLNKVRVGGYVVYMRHTKTDNDQSDSDVGDLTNCAMQRNLSDEGRVQAKMIGDMLTGFGVHFGAVLVSPYCRAVDTAQIMLSRYVLAPELSYLTRMTPEDAATATTWLRTQLGTAPAQPGTNTLLVSHTANLKTGTGIWPKNAGDFIVFEPSANGEFAYIGTITPEEWSTLGN